MTLFEAGRDIPATTSEQQEVEDDQFNEQTPTPTAAADSEGLPIIQNLFDWLQSAFAESPE